jgi:hypothetical protein
MAIQSRKNQYQGINAHLHSSLQGTAGGWEGFHGNHITHLAEAINASLPSSYLVDSRPALQIREYDPVEGARFRRLSPDIAIYEAGTPVSSSEWPSSETASTPTMTLSALETLDFDSDLYLRAVIIWKAGRSKSGKPGKPVTWIELLSPTNKPGGTGYVQYIQERATVLREGMVLVEVDYLHETRSPISRLPSYPGGESGAHPYTITVSDPRPTLQDGRTDVYGFDVDAPLPIIDLPLAGKHTVQVNFGQVYNRTFESLAAYSYRVNYAQPPERLETYREADQARIEARLAAVLDAHERGIDLETGPFEIERDEEPAE